MPPLRILIPKMRLFGFLPFLVPFIFLGGVQEPGLVDGFFFKACPKVRIKCEVEERNQCMRHRHCPDSMKCCLFSCGKKCLDLRKDVCSMPKETGPCFAYLPRWWYDKETELCSRFIYGGCQGNPNNFPSEAICLVICKKRCKSHGSQTPPILTRPTLRDLGISAFQDIGSPGAEEPA
ncbi:WAP four-disulfide core domain protein 6A-like [Castor canadensis]|uniref:WAP four-disulfide core domain protein 6A-like n=1 Tax=Castor canadensis TaxID=51338 RepID=A0AC58MGK9_CASCN